MIDSMVGHLLRTCTCLLIHSDSDAKARHVVSLVVRCLTLSIEGARFFLAAVCWVSLFPETKDLQQLRRQVEMDGGSEAQ